MNKQIYAIGILSVTAVMLLIANFVPMPHAQAQEAIVGRDYSVVTAPVQTGGDALYVLDNRAGQIAVFTYDPNARQVQPRAVRPIADAFQR